MKMRSKVKLASSSNELFAGLFGIEIEENRVDLSRNSLSRFPHQKELGDRQGKKTHFQTDFAESMEELVTDKHATMKGVLEQMRSLQSILHGTLKPNEIIWPMSMPPKLSEDDVDFVRNTFKRFWMADYRKWLTKRYGIFRQIMCGIHFNYSPSDQIIAIFQSNHHIKSKKRAQTELLFQIAQQLVGERWLITYLFGATPLSENSDDQLFGVEQQVVPVRSLRSSKYGYENAKEIHVSYGSLSEYVNDLQHEVNSHKLFSESEFYGPVRLKAKDGINSVRAKGFDYLELRTLDLDPFDFLEINLKTLDLIHLLIVDAIINPQEWSDEQLDEAKAQNNQVALQHPTDHLPSNLEQQASVIMKRINRLVQYAPDGLKVELEEALAAATKKLMDPNLTPAAQLIKFKKQNSLMDFGVQRGKQLKQQYANQSVTEAFPGINPDMVNQYIEKQEGING
ncbi:glutamate--cysteine ligase [Fructilactobacillus fructivorans]|nr:glutamate--cysteine ligase [Fructilactobacillus fructivorans]MCT2867608.1 glutamate--cysteine ligase [Fructilactobacillus fructivorans]MCT2868874.1 glutamate--cysteine ligase [Fructilactobacillus fructivorans]MCT2873956.1 glutamate--cysteine ligase [Fructilactobacillus fructivorans]